MFLIFTSNIVPIYSKVYFFKTKLLVILQFSIFAILNILIAANKNSINSVFICKILNLMFYLMNTIRNENRVGIYLKNSIRFWKID